MVYQASLYQKVIRLNPSPANGLEFSVGTLAESTEGGFREVVDTYAAQQRIAHVHFRNVRGQVPNDNETGGVWKKRI